MGGIGMSMTRLSAVAAQREQGGARRVKRKPGPGQEAETEPQGYLDLLVTAIPTEPLALYTFLISGIVATIDANESLRLTMRWWIYGVMIAFIALWLLISYRRRPKAERDRKLPFAEIAAAVAAFATWGLVMPESPLNAELKGDDQVVWTLIITAIGVALVGLITGSLKKPVTK
jgi:amino acid transporter